MAEERSHKTTATRIAKKFGTTPQTEGPDIKTSNITVEVETAASVSAAVGQLRGHRGPVYVAGVNTSYIKS